MALETDTFTTQCVCESVCVCMHTGRQELCTQGGGGRTSATRGLRTVCSAVARRCSSALSTSLCATLSTSDSAAAASALTSIVVSAPACGRCAGNMAMTPSLRVRASCVAVSHLEVSRKALTKFSIISALDIFLYKVTIQSTFENACFVRQGAACYPFTCHSVALGTRRQRRTGGGAGARMFASRRR